MSQHPTSQHGHGNPTSGSHSVGTGQPGSKMGQRSALVRAGITLALGLVLSWLLYSYSEADLHHDARVQFERLTERLVTEASRRVNQVVYGLNGARGVYAASKSVERLEFRAFVHSRDMAKEFPGALGMGFIQRVERSGLEAFIAAERADDAPDFAVRTSGDAPDLYVIKFIDPLEPNRRAIGYDVGSEPNRRAGIEHAVETGLPTITGRITLVQDEQKRTGFLYYVPVYKNGTHPQTPAERWAALAGIVYAPIVLEETLAGVDEAAIGLLDFEIFDGETPCQENKIFDLDGHLQSATGEVTAQSFEGRMFHAFTRTHVGGRTWTLITSTTPKFNEAADNAVPELMLGGGVVLSVLLGVVGYFMGSAQGRAQALALSMTRELSESKDAAESALREVVALRTGLDRHAIISVADARGRITDVNTGFCKISGYAREELIGQDHRVLNSGRHPKEFWVQMWKTVAGGDAWRGEVCNRDKGGAEYWVDSTIVPFMNAEGKIEKYVSIRFDITSKKLADEEKARLVSIVTGSDDAIVSKTTEGIITSWNRGAERLFGYTSAQAIGQKVTMLIPADRLDEETHIMSRILKGEMVHHFETRRRRADGSEVDIAATISPIRDERGRVIGASKIARDITEQKRIQGELDEARQRAEAASATKSEFLANMSHEIRTPMTAILGYTDLLGDESGADATVQRRQEYLDTIKRNGEHLLTIINDILDISKIEAGKMTVERIETRPDHVVHDVLSLMRVKAQGKGLVLECNFETPIPACVKTDPVRLRQILVNLVGNSIKFTEVGGVTVRIGHDAQRSRIVMSVEDTGIGLSQEQVGRLFGAFVQADTSTTRKFGGTGLGLRISKRLAEMLGGDITVTSVLGSGSTFTLTFDTGDIHGVDMIVPGRTGQIVREGARRVSESTSITLTGVRVLLVEDGPDNQRLISFHLRKAGADVRIVSDGRQAIEALTLDGTLDGPLMSPPPVDVVLTDMQMPEMDGYTEARTLRNKGCELPIVALTAHAMAGDLEKCMHAGCDGYASKPIDKQRLLEVCRQAADGTLRNRNDARV